MRINSINSRNYRTLEYIDLVFKSNYCTLSGHNNAGKSAIITLINILLYGHARRPWTMDEYTFLYEADKTQWIKESPDISIIYNLTLTRSDDLSLIAYIERLTSKDLSEADIELSVSFIVNSENDKIRTIAVGGEQVSEDVGKDILARLRASDTLILHNSTQDQTDWYVGGGRAVVLYDLSLNETDKSLITEAEERLQKQLKRVAKAQTAELNAMLGKLKDKYGVELSTPDSTLSRRVPLTINLTDKSVEIPLPGWGSGTQNRTRILMSMLAANRIRTGDKAEDRTTPIVVIEEPESFLHPSAQAEFGTILQSLSEELKIQVIVSTHSPYMLNQAQPDSNILLRRKVMRGKSLMTEVVKSDGEQWMVPYAEHLGIIPPEFEGWRKLISSTDADVILVEGDIDKEYLEYCRLKYGDVFKVPLNVQIVSYGGKDALKNTLMMKFVLQKLRRFFVTFDLDAAGDVTKSLTKIGLEDGKHFLAVGVDKAGRQAIEGLLPERVLKAVHARETETIMQLTSPNATERNSAKSRLKHQLLLEFKTTGDLSMAELKPLLQLGQALAKPFVKTAPT